jgi:hypothetical protein
MDSYYFLTEMPYKYSDLFETNSGDSWYGMAALEWVSQIGFCHHYINNRVCFMTGGTGVGKSTHVPKLYAYYLKAIDYKSNGRVVCTQPRITPTKTTAETVSKQLGLSILNTDIVDGKKKDIFTDNYYMQLQYKGKKHSKNVNHLIIKIVTDGLLYQEVKNLKPLFKKEKIIKNKSKFGDNLYDVIIVDEAHEHNKNIDLILTVMRLYTYYNPSIRLVILSATIDTDEPIYRRYYRIINDNLKYPLDINIKINKIDRVNVDRRYHISPPGASTRFPIKEYYHDDKTDIVLLTQQIIRGAKGNILIFQPGQKDIINLVENLNTILPTSWIALPFYSELNTTKREFVEKLDVNLQRLHINKDDDFNEINNLYDKSKPTYTNFVMVATNIAEASITINSLYYVIETGKRKNDYYDYEKKNSRILETPISESSRLQRKGRVGRVQPGEVHYLYKENALLFNKTPVEFSIQNISDAIYSLLKNSNNEKEFLIDDYINDRFLGILFTTKSGRYDYIGKNRDLMGIIPKYYETGYDLRELLDGHAKYYIVHPDDLEFTRNIIGKIVELKTSNVEFKDRQFGIISSKKINSYIEDFKTFNYLSEENTKTDFGLLLQTIDEKFQFDNPTYGKIILNSILLDNVDDTVILVAALDVLRNDIKTLFQYDDVNGYYKLEKTKTNEDSDLKYIINLLKQFISYVTQRYPFFDINKLMENYIKNTVLFNKNNIKSIIVNYEISDDDLDREIIIDNFFEYINNLIDNNFSKYIIKWCEITKVDHKKLLRFIPRYLKILDSIKQLYYPDKRDKNYSDIIYKYKKNYLKYLTSSIDKLKLGLVLSLPYNLCINITGTEQYLSLYNPTIDNIYALQKIKGYDGIKKIYRRESFIDLLYLSGYIIYLNFRNDTISGLTNIDKQYVKILNKIYNRKRLESTTKPVHTKIEKYLQKIKDQNKFKVPLSKDYSTISKIGSIYDKIISDIE